MSDNLYQVIELENEVYDLIENHKINKDEENRIISKLQKKLVKLNNNELLYLLSNGTIIHNLIDVLIYFKKYRINKKELKESNSYKEELNKLNNFIENVRESVLNEDEYMYICSKCDVDNIASYLLDHMSNEDIMSLSNESNDWNYKLFLYGNLKA